jgi:hypothetical protein
MKTRSFLIILFLSLAVMASAQPSEIIYPGTTAKSGYENNASYGPFEIGFNFTFFGNSYSQFHISTNGLLTFGAGTADPSEDPIPASGDPNNFIAAFWDDLVIDPSGNILYTTVGASPNRKLIVQFRNMGFYYGPVYVGTFSVILYETSNKIQTQYRVLILPSSPLVHGENATIGIENSDGTAGIEYAYHNPTAITTGQAISFTPSGATYTMDSDALYDGVYLTTNLTLPEPGIPQLISPVEDAVIGADHTFSWAEASDAASYTLKISTNSNLSGATNYNAGSALSYNVTGLELNTTYYWGVFATNATGITWCEIRRFTTSSTPPLMAVPQTIWTEQNKDKTIKLNYTGGDESAKTATITSLPAQGQLYQYSAGARGALISSVPAPVTDPNRNVIYSASGSTGNGAGNFKFFIHDDSGNSPEEQITVNVSPPGMPNLLFTGKSTTFIEMQFDRTMNDPAGKEAQFELTVNGSPVTISALSLKTGDPCTIVATFASSILLTDAVTISYTAGDISSTQGGYLATFDPQTINLLAQTITFSTNLTRRMDESPFALSATSTSGLSLTFSSSNLAVATVGGSTATLRSVGTSQITARQSGNSTYAPANFSRTLSVSIGNQTITFGPLPEKFMGDPDFNLSATASSGLTVSYSSSNPLVATVAGNVVHITGTGSTIITASQTGNSNWNPAADVPQTLVVNISTGTENPSASQKSFNIYTTGNIIYIQPLADEWEGKYGIIRVIDITGRPVSLNKDVLFSIGSRIELQADYVKGLYIIDIRSGINKYTRKIVIK